VSELRDPETIRRDIETSRQQLGDSVEALAAKVNIRARARAKLDDGRCGVGAAWRTAHERKLLLIATGVVAVVALLAAARGREP
jgi:hypothetical protein